MLLSPIRTSDPHSLTGCTIASVKVPGGRVARPVCFRSTSSSSIPRVPSLQTTQDPERAASAAIEMPSPPLTPNAITVQDPVADSEYADATDFLFPLKHPMTRPVLSSLSVERLASSAPSAISLLEAHSMAHSTTGFTFSANIPANQVKEKRECYERFISAMEDDYWKSVSTVRTTYFFDGIGRGGGFLSIPHLASHGNAKTNVICRLLEAWLTKKLVEPTISDSIPVLEDNIESSVLSIEQCLRQDPKVWAGISKSFIRIRCGHVFMLDTCCDDETIVHLGADEFYQDYPLFVDVEIKMQCDTNNSLKEQPVDILIAFQNIVNGSKDRESVRPYVHRVIIEEPRRRSSQDTAKV